MAKINRKDVYDKLNGHCGYCGKEIMFNEMQVDHMNPKCLRPLNTSLFEGVIVDKTDNIENLMPTCRRCNHYKGASTVEQFRYNMKTLHKRLEKLYTHKVALDYGIVKIEPFNGIFYFERI
jgi:5-methylcytosine-specific restriction endonuclease McrA